MKLLSVSIGSARPTPGRVSSKTGIFKEPVDHPVLIGREGLAGDRIVNRKHHGGPEQAVYLECAGDLDWWSTELGYPVGAGHFGENLVFDGVSNRDLSVGDRFQIGDVVLEVTSPRTPCATFSARMGNPAFVKRYTRAGRPGAYLRVLAEGSVRAGDIVHYTPFPGAPVPLPEMLALGARLPEGEAFERFLGAPVHAKLRARLQAG